MRSLETLIKQLEDSERRESDAATRLRRAQTIFDKHYQRTIALRRQLNAARAIAHNTAMRLLGDNQS